MTLSRTPARGTSAPFSRAMKGATMSLHSSHSRPDTMPTCDQCRAIVALTRTGADGVTRVSVERGA